MPAIKECAFSDLLAPFAPREDGRELLHEGVCCVGLYVESELRRAAQDDKVDPFNVQVENRDSVLWGESASRVVLWMLNISLFRCALCLFYFRLVAKKILESYRFFSS